MVGAGARLGLGGCLLSLALCHFCSVSLSAPQDPLAVDGKFSLLFPLILVDLGLTERGGGRSVLETGQMHF